jgi:uncharacterized repeat protein (TIGR03803 family)
LLITLLSSFVLHPSSLAHAQAAAVLTTLYSFTGGHDGANPQAALVQGSDGYFYETTEYGGAYTNSSGYGTVFKVSTNGALATLYSFGSVTNGSGDALDGSNPVAGLVQGRDGSFYGTTQPTQSESGDGGGCPKCCGPGQPGTVFKVRTNGVLTRMALR